MPGLPVALGETFAEKYRVERVLGEGGMGVVLLAHHLELDQPVAIKVLLDGLAESVEGAERFRREARAAAKIQSDNVVRVFDVGVLDQGARYMVMEYLHGHDLAAELADTGPLPIAKATRILLEAADAVEAAHSAGIVHRDLKPANIFLAERGDGRVRVKVLDFGISKGTSSLGPDLSLTTTSAWIGSPLYMAPEQMQSPRDVDHRADIWSLGAIAFELFAGRPPYLADSLPQLCNLLLTVAPPPIEELRPDVPPELAKIVNTCLSRDPNGRYASVRDLIGDLTAFAASLSGASRPSFVTFSGVNPAGDATLPVSALSSETKRSALGAISGKTAVSWVDSKPGEVLVEVPPASTSRRLRTAALALVGIGALVGAFFILRPVNHQAALVPAPGVVGTEAEEIEAVQRASADRVSTPSQQPGLQEDQNSTPTVVDDGKERDVSAETTPISGKIRSTANVKKSSVASKKATEPEVSARSESTASQKASSTEVAPAPTTTKVVPEDDFAKFGGRR